MARASRSDKKGWTWATSFRQKAAPRSRVGLGLESLEQRIVLDATGFAGNECPPDLDLSMVAVQQAQVGETLSFNLYTAGATVEDLNADDTPTNDTIRLLLDPDVPADTPEGATLTVDGDFSWTPSAGQVGTFAIVVIAVDEGTPPLADAETFTIEVTTGNQAPEVDLNGPGTGIDFSATFTEGAGPVQAVDAAELTVADGDDTNISTAIATITNLADGAAEILAVDVTGTAITANYDDTTGELTLSGSDTIANYQQVLRTLTYDNTSQNPTTNARVVEVVVNDGDTDSATATATITVDAVNDPPVVDLNGPDAGEDFEATFTESSGAAAIVGTGLTVDDVDNANLASATATITNLLDGADEVLAVDTTGTGITALYDDTTGVLTLSGSDTLANYQQVLRSLTYDNTSTDPTTTARSIAVVANDGADPSVARTATVNIMSVNNAPNLATVDDQNGSVGEEIVIPVSATDADADDTLTFDLDFDNSPSDATITKLTDTTAEIRWTPSAADLGTMVAFVVLVSDNGSPARADSESFSVTVQAVRPVVDLNGDGEGIDLAASFTEGDDPEPLAESDLSITTDSSATIAGASATITNLQDGGAELLDVDTTGTSITAGYSAGVLTLSGEDSIANYQSVLASLTYENTSEDPTEGDRTVSVVVNDGTVDSLAAVATVSVQAVNDFPNLALPSPFDNPDTPADATQAEQVTFTAMVTDVDHTLGEINFLVDSDASGLPEGANVPTIDADGNFSWTPDVVGAFSFRIIAIDAAGGVDQEEVAFTVAADTTAPTIATAPAGTLASPVTSLQVVFSEPMDTMAFSAANYSLEIVGGSGVSIASITSFDLQTATIALDSALADDNYRLTIMGANIEDEAGNALAGATTFDFAVETPPALAEAFAEFGARS